jgi:hypothetical protein
VDAVKVAVAEPTGTEIEVGTVSTVGAVLARATVAAAPETALDIVTVHVVDALAPMLVFAHCSEESVIVAAKVSVTGWETLL